MKPSSDTSTDLSVKLEEIDFLDETGALAFDQADRHSIDNLPSTALGYLYISLRAYEKEKDIVLNIKQDPKNLVKTFLEVYDLGLHLDAINIAKTSCQSMITLYEMLIENNINVDQNKEELADRHDMLANLYFEEKNAEQAKIHAQKNIDIMIELSHTCHTFDNSNLAYALTCMGTIVHDLDNDLPEAIKLYEQAKDIYEKNIKLHIYSYDDLEYLNTILKTLNEYYCEINDLDNLEKTQIKIIQLRALLVKSYNELQQEKATFD